MPRKAQPTANETGAPIQYSELAMRQNINILEYSRTFQAVASGCAAGIIGLTGLYGFAFYFVILLLQSVFWYLKAGGDWSKFFIDRTLVVSYSVLGGLFTYVLFWTFLYGMVHVY